jgi:kanamycin kinase
VIAQAPSAAEAPVPAAVVAYAAGRRLEALWLNELGGLTYRVGDELVLKWAPAGTALDLAAEAERLAWAASFVTVPAVVDSGSDRDGRWLVTALLPGENAVTPRWLADPATAVAAVGAGLRALHDRLPVARCPFDWSAAARVADAQRRGLDAALLQGLSPPPEVDRLVVCHGDACAPNTLITDDGRWSGHVDLGQLGVADRWADLAVATWSTQWNYGDGWEQPLLDAYGVDADPERTDYYRRLWDVGP